MAEPKFEASLQRLEEIVQRLESGDMPLEESLRVFEEGMKLAAFCSKKLEEAEKKVTLLTSRGEGDVEEVPFNPGGKGDDDE